MQKLRDQTLREGIRIWRRFLRHKFAIAGLGVIGLLVICAVFAPLIAPYNPYAIGGTFSASPDAEHLLGTDSIGRDVLSRLIYGSRVSMSVGVGAVIIATLLGIALGLEAGYFGGFIDTIIMRTADVFLSFPAMILLMVISSIVGPGLDRMIIIMGLLGWPGVARLARGNVLSIKQLDYTKSAVALGFKNQRILFFHILPNAMGPILVNATFGVARSILVESSLSFLGMGVNPPTATWGNMLTDAQSLTTLTARPWLWVPPGLMILVSVLAFNFVGDGLRDALDPNK
ncbi:MAG: ABC transporter permease [Spirochaetaceae bacterium]|jgi:peptide/nickel transport system permease protein|nr:ABC transporter permease [Spirochaetaceae bacterium]